MKAEDELPTADQCDAIIDLVQCWQHGEGDNIYADMRSVLASHAQRLETLRAELDAAYLELRKQRPAIKAVFDRDVWDRAGK